MADYDHVNYDISNPLNIGTFNIETCPLCKKNAKEKIHRIHLSIWSGNPCTQDPKKKDLDIFTCTDCAQELRKSVVQFLNTNRTTKKLPLRAALVGETLVEGHICPYCTRDTWGSRIVDNSYYLRMEEIRSYKSPYFKTYMCHSCRQKLYKHLTNFINDFKPEKDL